LFHCNNKKCDELHNHIYNTDTFCLTSKPHLQHGYFLPHFKTTFTTQILPASLQNHIYNTHTSCLTSKPHLQHTYFLPHFKTTFTTQILPASTLLTQGPLPIDLTLEEYNLQFNLPKDYTFLRYF
jgi:hypothetical protein